MRPAYALVVYSCITGAVLLGIPAANAETISETPTSEAQILKGLWLTTSFPEITERIGDNIKLDLTLQNKALPPRRVELSVEGLPAGWKSEFSGAGKVVTSAIVDPDQSQSLSLTLTPPSGIKPGPVELRVVGHADADTLELPLKISLAEAKPPAVKLDPKLPALRGTPRSNFDFQVTIKNDGPDDQTFNLLAQAPAGFEATFKEQYGTQELTSIPIKAGESKDVTVSVKLPQDAGAGQYPVQIAAASAAVHAETQLLLDVTGQPTLALGGPEGRLSADATAGRERTFNFTLRNTGTAPARDVKLDATAPEGWKVTFNPETVPSVDANAEVPVAVSMTPAGKAIAGDYVVNVRANGDGASDTANFRVTVLTSTVWGVAGLGVIGAAAIVLAVAVGRYGRR